MKCRIQLKIVFCWKLRMFIAEFPICCTCGICYIGQTKGNVWTRLKEHIRATILEKTDKSSIAEHFFIHKHYDRY